MSGPAGVDGAAFGTIAGDNVAVVGFFVGAATTGGKMVGVARVAVVNGAVFGGTIAGDDGAVVGASVGAATGGNTVGVALVGGGGFGGAAADGGMIGAAAFGNTVLGTRTDFLHRLQSNVFTGAVASTTSGAEQCGQSKRMSLLTVPVFDAPPFCIVGNGSSHYTIIIASQLGTPDEILNPDFVPTWHSCLPSGNLIPYHNQLINRYLYSIASERNIAC